jgi:lipoprotein-anchoring transpeptidase ErfK/SrfK
MSSKNTLRALLAAGALLTAAAPAQAQFFPFGSYVPDSDSVAQPKPRSPRMRPIQPVEDEPVVDLSHRTSLRRDDAPRGGDPGYAELPPDADPNYSTPVALDPQVDYRRTTQKIVPDTTGQPAGTLVIDTRARRLTYALGDGSAVQYSIAVGKQGFSWKGEATVGRKAFWPGWTPPPEMLERRPDLPEHMDGSLSNPLGARALYLFQGRTDTLFRIHGTNEPNSIGHAASSGCIRMHNSDVIDLYKRVTKGARVVVM